MHLNLLAGLNKVRDIYFDMSMNLIDREKQSILQTYGRLAIIPEKANGVRICDIDGKEYLDFLGGIAVNILGHSHPEINKAINDQIQKYTHLSNYFYQKPQIELAEKLKALTSMDSVFFANTGAETSEGALKIARKWGSIKGKKKLIAFRGGFHGRTYGALSMMDKPKYKDGFGPFLEDISIIPFNDVEALSKEVDEQTQAVFFEVIQGEGGLNKVSKEFVARLNELKEIYDFIVMVDEVQSGMYRTGKFCAFQHYDLLPDVVTLAKGLGGGLPLGAIITNEIVSRLLTKGTHGTTFGGNAVSCVAGLKSIEILEKEFLDSIVKNIPYLHSKLDDTYTKFPSIVKEIRGMGYMVGLNLAIEARPIVDNLIDYGVIANSTGDRILRLVPPLIITSEDIDFFFNALWEVLFTKLD